MKVEYIKKDGASFDLSEIKISMTIARDKETRSRVLTFTHLANKDDPNMPKFMAETGNAVRLTDENLNYFGYVFRVSYDENDNTATFTAYDPLFYLKSKVVKKFNNKRAEEITKDLCSEFNIPINYLESTSKIISKKYISKSIFEIMSDAYNMEKESYFIEYDNGLNIKKIGSEEIKIEIKTDENIESMSHDEDATNVINSVIICDDKGNIKGSPIKDDKLINQFGKLQETSNKKEEAQKMIQGPTMATSLTLSPGNLALKMGRRVRVISSHFDLYYKISSDTHVWTGEEFKTTLSLEYEGN